MINCVQHNYRFYFVIQEDFLKIGAAAATRLSFPPKQSYPFAASLRVLETWTNDRLRDLESREYTDEQVAASPELLWLDMEWSSFCQRALHIFESTTFQTMLPRLVQAGYASRRYIKRLAGQNVMNDARELLVYATYKEAQRDRAHPGEIIHQVLFLSNEVNRAIAALYPSEPEPPAGAPPPPAPEEEKGGAQRGPSTTTEQPSTDSDDGQARGGNNSVSGGRTLSEINHTITLPKTGRGTPSVPHQGTQNGELPRLSTPTEPPKNARTPSQLHELPSRFQEPPVPKNGNNKDSKSNLMDQSHEKASNSTGARAGATPAPDLLSQFDFFQDYDENAVLTLCRLIMPLPRYRTETKQQTAELALTKATAELAEMPFLRERGLAHLARLLYYFADIASPCSWRAEIHESNPGVQVRPWHLSERVVAIASREMERADWWPSELPRMAGVRLSQGQLALESLPEAEMIDLAELAGVPPEERCGMTRDEALGMQAYLRSAIPADQFPGVFVDFGRVVPTNARRGYYIEFWYADGRFIRFYSHEDWELIQEYADLIGSEVFAQCLERDLRRQEVAADA